MPSIIIITYLVVLYVMLPRLHNQDVT